MKLTRTTIDRPDFLNLEDRQPTCYDARNPICPWMAAEDAPDDTDDRDFARTWAALRQDGVNVSALELEDVTDNKGRKIRARIKLIAARHQAENT